MATSAYPQSQSMDWKELYQLAILELDPIKLPGRIVNWPLWNLTQSNCRGGSRTLVARLLNGWK